MMERDDDPLGMKPDGEMIKGKPPAKFIDPCDKARSLSMKCLEENSYDRTKCAAAFNNYRECKKLWTAQRKNLYNQE